MTVSPARRWSPYGRHERASLVEYAEAMRHRAEDRGEIGDRTILRWEATVLRVEAERDRFRSLLIDELERRGAGMAETRAILDPEPRA